MEKKKKSPDYLIPASHFKTVRPVERLDAPKAKVAPAKAPVPNEPAPSLQQNEVLANPQQHEILATPQQKTETKPETAPPPKAKPALNIGVNSGKKVSALSLKSIKEKQQLQAQNAKEDKAADLPKEDFSQEALEENWKAYTAKMEKKGRYNLVSHLSMALPQKQDNHLVLEYPNATIKVELESASHELLAFLRKRLKNYDIELDIRVNEEIQKRYAYTPREKYDKLKEINPLMDTLRQEFDLEI